MLVVIKGMGMHRERRVSLPTLLRWQRLQERALMPTKP